MNGPGDYHTKWSKSDREIHGSCDTAFMQNFLKVIQMSLLNRLTDLDNELQWLREKFGGGDNLEFGIDIHTLLMFKTDNPQGLTV